jgi:cold shock CspA family protein
MTGTISSVVREKGFGFIRDEAGQSRFFHAKDLAFDFDLIQVGRVVRFDPATGPQDKGNGLRAVHIEVTHDSK